jgi:DNA-binding NarL/FixJ family response regulator
MYEESVYAERCLKIGAKGYIMKQEPSRKMLEAIRKILNGEVYLSDGMREKFLDRFVGNITQPAGSPVEVLSNRELGNLISALCGKCFCTRSSFITLP